MSTLAALPARPRALRDTEAVSADMQALIVDAETAVDQALAAVARLGAGLPEARLRLGVSAVVAQGVFDSAAAAQGALTQARGKVVDVHNGMEAVRRKFGIPMMDAPEPKTNPSRAGIDTGEETIAA